VKPAILPIYLAHMQTEELELLPLAESLLCSARLNPCSQLMLVVCTIDILLRIV
jgi:hypothetical protein